jgi:YesN/AraC family two-component response regulator
MSYQVLLAEDHVLVREGLKNILLQEGFEIAAEASNGREAVTMARKHRPDIALIDVSMPC